jgi:transcriptional regulator with XRE-family HTH domain
MATEFARRLREVRLFQNIKQQDLADQSGLSIATIKNFETGSSISFGNVLRIITALGLTSELENLFLIQPQSIADLEKIEKLQNKKIRQRARSKK